MQWLKEADEEESSEDEANSDLEVVYDDRAPHGNSTVTTTGSTKTNAEDDLDIDAI